MGERGSRDRRRQTGAGGGGRRSVGALINRRSPKVAPPKPSLESPIPKARRPAPPTHCAQDPPRRPVSAGQLLVAGAAGAHELIPISPGMQNPTKFEAGQIAARAAALHGHQGEQLPQQAVAKVWRNSMGLAVRTPGLPEHWGYVLQGSIRAAAQLSNGSRSSTQHHPSRSLDGIGSRRAAARQDLGPRWGSK